MSERNPQPTSNASQTTLAEVSDDFSPQDTNEETSNDASKPDVESLSPKKRANDLDGKAWTRNSISIWSDIRKTSEEMALGHPAMFPVALITRLIESFTTGRDRIVLDPFAGIGSTVVAAQRLGKHGVGTELSPIFAKKAQERCMQRTLLDIGVGSGVVYQADARDLLQYVDAGTVDFVATSPPYWDILNEKRTADYKEIRNYGNYENDLGAVADYREFLRKLAKVFEQVYAAMRNGAYCCVIVMDLRKKNKFFPFHSDVAAFMQDVGFIYDDIIIWDRRHEYNNMRPLGYPAVFRINKVHEFILIFKKPC